MSKSQKSDDQGGVPVRTGDPVHDYPDGIPVVVPPVPDDVPESADSGPKAGQQAAPQKKES